VLVLDCVLPEVELDDVRLASKAGRVLLLDRVLEEVEVLLDAASVLDDAKAVDKPWVLD